ncbi:MAG: hypothetical protein R3F45_09885 [Gammaproteobacteria bacterium]
MRALNRMLVCIATVLATLLPSTSSARDNVYFNFGFSSGFPATRYYSYPYPAVVHAVPVYPPPVRHYYHYYTPRHYYHHYTPQHRHHYYKPRHGHFDRRQPHHQGRRDDYRHRWRDGGDRYHRDRGHDDRRGGSRTFVKRDD